MVLEFKLTVKGRPPLSQHSVMYFSPPPTAFEILNSHIPKMGLDSKCSCLAPAQGNRTRQKAGEVGTEIPNEQGGGEKKKSNLKEMSAASNHCVLASPPHRTPLLLTYIDRRASTPTLCLRAANVSAGSLRARWISGSFQAAKTSYLNNTGLVTTSKMKS